MTTGGHLVQLSARSRANFKVDLTLKLVQVTQVQAWRSHNHSEQTVPALNNCYSQNIFHASTWIFFHCKLWLLPITCWLCISEKTLVPFSSSPLGKTIRSLFSALFWPQNKPNLSNVFFHVVCSISLRILVALCWTPLCKFLSWTIKNWTQTWHWKLLQVEN